MAKTTLALTLLLLAAKVVVSIGKLSFDCRSYCERSHRMESCFCEFSRSSLLSMLQGREPGRKHLLTVGVPTFRDGSSNINRSSETNIAGFHVSSFHPKCLAKMKKRPFLRQCILSICSNSDGGGDPVVFAYSHLHFDDYKVVFQSKSWFTLWHKHKHKPTYADAVRCC